MGAWQVGKKYRMLSGMSKIDFEYKLLMGEGLLSGSLFLLSPLLIFYSPFTLWILALIDFAIIFCIALCAGYSNRRKDVIMYFPIYYFLRYIDCACFLYAFWLVVIQRKKIFGWNHVARYKIKEDE
jgi:hypothetical protein